MCERVVSFNSREKKRHIHNYILYILHFLMISQVSMAPATPAVKQGSRLEQSPKVTLASLLLRPSLGHVRWPAAWGARAPSIWLPRTTGLAPPICFPPKGIFLPRGRNAHPQRFGRIFPRVVKYLFRAPRSRIFPPPAGVFFDPPGPPSPKYFLYFLVFAREF